MVYIVYIGGKVSVGPLMAAWVRAVAETSPAERCVAEPDDGCDFGVWGAGDSPETTELDGTGDVETDPQLLFIIVQCDVMYYKTTWSCHNVAS